MPQANRAGTYVRQLEGYTAFIPAPLPPDPRIEYDPEMTQLLDEAQAALGRLDGVTVILPSPNFFVNMYSRLEAVLSSQIEGTQSSLQDVLEYEVDPRRPGLRGDVRETFNYFKAMRYGLERLEELPVCLRLIKEIHRKLLEGVRGGTRTPGEFRRSQNWIGPEGAQLNEAVFVPPPPHEANKSLGNLEKFLHERGTMPVLVHCGVAHAQFETIHPFLDGNGRVGRLLITFLLCWRGVLSKPLLYLSHYLRTNRLEYYDRLMAVRSAGDWEGWLKFFLRGVLEVSTQATDTARAIVALREEHRVLVDRHMPRKEHAHTLLGRLFEHPLVSARRAADDLKCSPPTANALIARFAEMGLLREITGKCRNRLYIYDPLLNLLPATRVPVNTQE